MARTPDTINLQGLDLIFPKPVRSVGMVKIRVFISFPDHPKFSSLLPVCSARTDQLHKLVFAKQPENGLSCTQ
jgi:hypothetical protein